MQKIYILLLIYVSLISFNASGQSQPNYLVVLSLDGFRWDYPSLYHTPTLDSIARNGVKADQVIPSFPSKTFPNHYTIATGLYPDNHGIINNSFYSQELQIIYSPGNRASVENPVFYHGEPSWVTAEKNGIISASYHFFGSETPIDNIQPTIWKRYSSEVPFKSMIDSIIHWLQKPYSERPRFITFYSDEPDWTSHTFGSESDKTRKVVESLDSLLSYFCMQKNQLPIADSINFIVLSDHGMASVTREKSVILKDYVSTNSLEYCLGSNPFFLLQPKSGQQDSIYSILSKVEGIYTWKKEEIPMGLHYGNNMNVSDLVICAKPGWGVYLAQEEATDSGTHGYTPDFIDMQAIFYAIGPDFRINHTIKAFQNIEFYNLFCELLRIKPRRNDGNLSNVSEVLRK